MKKSTLGVLAVVIMLVIATSIPAMAESATVWTEPFEWAYHANCLNGGLGDDLKVTGVQHNVLREMVKEDGRTFFFSNYHLSNVKGVGTSGVEYGMSESQTIVNNLGGPAQVLTAVTVFRLVSRNGDANIEVHAIMHMTWVDGRYTSETFIRNAVCK